MTKKRDKLEVIRDILMNIQEKSKIKPTRLIHSSNLSPQMFKDYVNLLLKRNLIKEYYEKNKKYFVLTNKGKEFILEYKSIEKTIENFGL